MNYATPMSYSRLNALGLITDAQQDVANAHPQRNAIGANASPARCLAWMVEQRIVSQLELIELWDEDNEGLNDADWEEMDEICDEALAACGTFSGRMNAELLAQLAADGLISKKQHKKAARHSSFVLQTPAQALAHVVLANAMSSAQFDALMIRVRTEKGTAESGQRARLLENAEIEINRLRKLYGPVSQGSGSRMRNWLRMLIVFFLLACCYLFYHLVLSVPACDSPVMTKTIQSLLRDAVRAKIPSAHTFRPALTHMREVGHAWARRQRACTANVVIEDAAIPYTYIVGPLPNKGNKVGVTAANREIVEARFSNIGYDGDFGNRAEPIGRENLEAAFRAGMARRSDSRPAFLPKSSIDQVMDLFSDVNQDRMREIADLEPIGNCRVISAETRYACRLLIEHNDPVRAMLGQLSRLLEAEFTFERDAVGKPWRMSEDFASSFDQAVAKGRPGFRSTNKLH